MPLNLIHDAWLPVLRNGKPDTIRPQQMAEDGVESLNWPRPDLNLACLELLIGLIYLADPPRDVTDWRERRADPERLRGSFEGLSSAFNLTGEGPLFLQDLENLHGPTSPPDMLFIDSAGESTEKKNADLMVKRARYTSLDLPMAAMALYTLQQFAPAGGAGNRTSIRGGGPMVSIIVPCEHGRTPLWSLVWANVPEGVPIKKEDLKLALPWMRPTRTSEKGQVTSPEARPHVPPEVFFGMPRRLRLVTTDGEVTHVIQRPQGTNYGFWLHPLSPYYSMKEGDEKLPRHPKPGRFGYRNWLGVVLEGKGKTAYRASCIVEYARRSREQADVLVGGWAMDKMKPLDFVWSIQPLFPLSEKAEWDAADMAEAADLVVRATLMATKDALGLEKTDSTLLEAQREEFYSITQPLFEGVLSRLGSDGASEEVRLGWLHEIRRVAMKMFDHIVLPELATADIISRDGLKAPSRRPNALRIIEVRKRLLRDTHSPKVYELLRLEAPEKFKKQRAA